MTVAETAARSRKVDRIVGVALEAGATAEDVATDPDVRDSLVSLSGVREPSLDTWKLVVQRLVAAEQKPWMDALVESVYATRDRVAARRSAGEPEPIGRNLRVTAARMRCDGSGKPGLDGRFPGDSDRCRVCSRDHVHVNSDGTLAAHQQGGTPR